MNKKEKNSNSFNPMILTFLVFGFFGWVLLAIYIKLPTQTWIDYFELPFTAIINVIVALGISYYLTENRTDKRKRKSSVEKIIDKILDELNKPYMIIIENDQDILNIRMIQRLIVNRFDLLKKHQEEFNYKDELKYVIEEFNNYWDLISNHIHDVNHLSKSRTELDKHIKNIIYKLEDIVFNLY